MNPRPYYHRRKTLTFGFILDHDASKQIRPCTESERLELILNGKCGVINSAPPLLVPSVHLSPTRITAPPRGIPILCQIKYFMISWWLPYLAKGPISDFNNGLGSEFNSDVSKQIRLCTGSGAPARKILVV